jgi:hypothetical protein
VEIGNEHFAACRYSSDYLRDQQAPSSVGAFQSGHRTPVQKLVAEWVKRTIPLNLVSYEGSERGLLDDRVSIHVPPLVSLVPKIEENLPLQGTWH